MNMKFISKLFTGLLLGLTANISIAENIFFQGVQVPTGTGAPSVDGYDAMAFAAPSRFLYALDSADGRMDVYERLDNGSLAFRSSLLENGMPLADPPSAGAFPELRGLRGGQEFAFTSSGEFMFMIGNGDSGSNGSLFVFFRDADSTGFVPATFQNSADNTISPGLFQNYNFTDMFLSRDTDNTALFLVGTNPVGAGVMVVLRNLEYESNNIPSPSIRRVSFMQDILVNGEEGVVNMPRPVAISAATNIPGEPTEVFVLNNGGNDSVNTDDAVVLFARPNDGTEFTFRSSVVGGDSSFGANTSSAASAFRNPTDLAVVDGEAESYIYVANPTTSSIFFIRQNDESGALIPDTPYTGIQEIGGVSDLLMLALNMRTIMYAAGTGVGGIGLFSVDMSTGLLTFVEDTDRIINGSVIRRTMNAGTSNEATVEETITGLQNVNNMVVSDGIEFLYAIGSNTNGVADPAGIVQFSRQSDLEVNLSVLNAAPQPGQSVNFRLDITNNGPADAPFVNINFNTSHPVSVTSQSSCEIVTRSNDDFSVNCGGAASRRINLASGASFTVTIRLEPTGITTARVDASVTSLNSFPGANGAPARVVTSSVRIGSFDAGALALSPWAYVTLFVLLMWRRRSTL